MDSQSDKVIGHDIAEKLRGGLSLADGQRAMWKRRVGALEEELYRVRTTQAAAAHALDTVRQYCNLPLIDDEHPGDTAHRIRMVLQRLRKALREAPDA